MVIKGRHRVRFQTLPLQVFVCGVYGTRRQTDEGCPRAHGWNIIETSAVRNDYRNKKLMHSKIIVIYIIESYMKIFQSQLLKCL